MAEAMPLWTFSLEAHGGAVVDQTVVAKGADETMAAASAMIVLDGHAGVALARPGRMAPPDAALRWAEACGDAFPAVLSNAGRLALYARGVAEPLTKPCQP